MGANENSPQLDGTEQGGWQAPEDWHLVAAAASTALEPYLREATGAAADWVAERWPEYVEKTLLPALSEAVKQDDSSDPLDATAAGNAGHSRRKIDPVRAGVIAGAAATLLGAAGIVLARR
jgi:hypothetical protein